VHIVEKYTDTHMSAETPLKYTEI